MEGWVKLYRELLEKPIWQCSSPEHKVILVTLLLMANHEEKEWIWQGKKYKCKPGQFITSLKGIAEKSGTSIKNVRTALKNFEILYGFLANKSTNKNRLITIINWELYQQTDNKVASKQASKWQASGKQVATNKNDKNDKNIYISPKGDTSSKDDIDFQKLLNFYNTTCKSLPSITAITPKRKQAINARVREHGQEAVYEMLKKAGRSCFLSGQNKNGWVASFDWIFRPNNFVKVLEGNYEDKDPDKQTTNVRPFKTRAEIEEEQFQRAKDIAFENLKKEGYFDDEG